MALDRELINLLGVPLIPGEQISNWWMKDISFYNPLFGQIPGRLVVTNYKLFFFGLSVVNKVN